MAASFRTIGVLVAFDPTANPLAAATSVRNSVEHVLIIDNTLDGHPRLPVDNIASGVSVLRNGNRGGLAGAYNAALSNIRAQHQAATHVVFIDDDTDVSLLPAFLQAESTRRLATTPSVAAVAPAYVDRATGLRGAPIRLSRFRLEVLPRDLEAPTEVSFLINSMAVWRLDVIAAIGPYSTILGVDHVDTDYCLRAALRGYKLVLNAQFSFFHSIGRRQAFRFLGMTLQSGGHSGVRRQMIARNTVILARRYAMSLPSFSLLCFMRLAYEAIGILLVESRRPQKLWRLLCGALEGLFTRYAD